MAARDEWLERAARLLERPEVQRWLEDDRVMKVLVGAIEAPRKIRRTLSRLRAAARARVEKGFGAK